MSGYTATGKTTTANIISDFLKQKGISHSLIRSDLLRKEMGHKIDPKYFDDNNKQGADKRDFVYLKMIDKALQDLANDNIAILDAGHNKIHMRERVYEISNNLKIPIVLVNTICEDENEIRKRIELRNKDNPLEVANKMEVYKYSKGLSDPIKKEVPMIRFDTKNNKIVSSTFNKNVRFIKKALK